MKRRLLIMLLASISFAVSAQKGAIDIGVLGGLNKSQIVGDGVYDYTHPINNNLLGVNIVFGLSNKMNWSVGVNQEIKGYHTKKKIVDINGNYEYDAKSVYSIEYLSIPVKLRYSLWSKGKHMANVDFGVYAGLKQKDSFEFQSEEAVFPPIKSNTKHNSFDAGLLYGVSYKYQFSKKLAFTLEANNSQGVISINDSRNYNNSTAVTLGILYRIRGENLE